MSDLRSHFMPLRRPLVRKSLSALVSLPFALAAAACADVADEQLPDAGAADHVEDATQALDAAWLDPNQDPARNPNGTTWDWNNAAWYVELNGSSQANCGYNGAPLVSPFLGSNSLGVNLTQDRSEPGLGWELYARRILITDEMLRSEAEATQAARCMITTTEGGSSFPHFMLYNRRTGVLRTFVWMGNARPVLGAEFLAIGVTLARGNWANSYTDAHQLFQHANPQASVNLSAPPSSYSTLLPWTNRWVVFDSQLAYDPGLASKDLFLRLDYKQLSRQELALSGSLSATITTDVTSAQSPSFFQVGERAVTSGASAAKAVLAKKKDVSSFATDLKSWGNARLTSTQQASAATVDPTTADRLGNCTSIACRAVQAGRLLERGAALTPWAATAAFFVSGLQTFFGSNTAAAPLVQHVSGSLALSGSITSKTPITFFGLGLSGTVQTQAGSVPYFAKTSGNAALGLFRYTRMPKLTIILARSGESVRQAYYVLEEPASALSVNPKSGMKVLSSEFGLADSRLGTTDPLPPRRLQQLLNVRTSTRAICGPVYTPPTYNYGYVPGSTSTVCPAFGATYSCSSCSAPLIQFPNSDPWVRPSVCNSGVNTTRAYYCTGDVITGLFQTTTHRAPGELWIDPASLQHPVNLRVVAHFGQSSSGAYSHSVGSTLSVTPTVLQAPAEMTNPIELAKWATTTLGYAVGTATCAANGANWICAPGVTPGANYHPVKVFRTTGTCAGGVRSPEQTIDLTTGYTNYTCASRFIPQCHQDGTFDNYYIERCEYAPN
jgi:hypothetical protein